MNNTTTYIGFSSIDYTGVDTLSTFALPITPMTFITPSNELERHRKVVWDFGDGTISESISASKYYEYPGIYNVSLIVYDCNNNAMISTVVKSISVYDFIPFTYNLDFNEYLTNIIEDSNLLYNGLFVLYNGINLVYTIPESNLKCGKINGPWRFNAFYPPYQPHTNIFYSSAGNNSSNYWNLDYKFKHLENFHTFYEKTYNYSISAYQYVEIDKIVPSKSSIYARVVNNSIEYCSDGDSGACFVGLSGTKDVYYKDDSISDMVTIDTWFDKSNIGIRNSPSTNYHNVLKISLSASIIDNTPTYLSVTSNGLDGEGTRITSFDINPIKYFNTKIPFVVKVKDVNNFTIKNFDSVEIGDIGFTILSSGSVLGSSQYNISSINYTLSSQNHGGAFRGYITFPYTGFDKLNTIQIQVSSTLINDQLSSYTLSGVSTAFNVYNKNYYDLWKVNEDFNPTQTLMDLRFQETLQDKTVLFETFFKDIFGDENSDHDAIGVQMYEKIANMVNNTQDLDYSEIDFLNSLAESIDYNNYGEEDYIYPNKIKRIMSLISMDRSKLIGELNKFRENFDVRGRTSKDKFGVNIGDKINPLTYTVSSNKPIVALEKFSNTYSLLNTYQPISALGSHTYPLSTYSSDWGWALVLPTTFNFSDIEKYYLFFDYVDVYDNTPVGGIIDFNNTKTTILSSSTSASLFNRYGVFDHILLDTLYQSLSMI
jgi:hypothetical protein